MSAADEGVRGDRRPVEDPLGRELRRMAVLSRRAALERRRRRRARPRPSDRLASG